MNTEIEKTGTIQTEKLEKAAFILKTVAHPLRLGLIQLLDKNGKMSVTDICTALKSEQSLTSHHLQTMKLKGLLKVQKDGRKMLYSLKEKDLIKLIACIENCDCNM